MSLNDALIMVITHARSQTLKLVADLSDDQLAIQPAPKMNHAAWVLGHLLVVDFGFRKLVTGEAAPEWVDDAVTAHRRVGTLSRLGLCRIRRLYRRDPVCRRLRRHDLARIDRRHSGARSSREPGIQRY